MEILRCEEYEDTIVGLIHKKKQFHGRTLFLTLKAVHKFVGKGRVDFGGSEFVETEKEILDPVKMSPEDNYGWWELDAGTYYIEYNESFETKEDRLYIISPSRRILHNGVFHPPMVTVESKFAPKGLLIVGRNGISIKQNARISLCKVFII